MKFTPLPASLSGEIVERLIRVDKSLLYLISGALEFVADREPYDETGALTVDQVRTALGEMIWTYYTEQPAMIPIGAVEFFGLSAPPDKWLECNGDSVAQATYPKLFDAIGENFGFAVGGNFVLPDLRFRTPLGLGELSSDPSFDIAIGQQAGQEVIALSTAELPAHSHQLLNNNSAARFRHSGTAGANASDAVVAGTTNNATAIMTTSAGSGAPFPLIQPGLGLLACIYAGE